MPVMEEEVWLPIAGYEGLYEVSNWGAVRSTGRIFSARGDEIGQGDIRIMRPQFLSGGYPRVHLRKHGTKPKNHNIHQLVAAAFLGSCPIGYLPVHNNGEREDNRVRNLKYKLHVRPREYEGRAIRQRGTNNRNSKLTENDVRRIRQDDRLHREIAQEYNISQSTVSDIKNWQSWGWLEDGK